MRRVVGDRLSWGYSILVTLFGMIDGVYNPLSDVEYILGCEIPVHIDRLHEQ